MILNRRLRPILFTALCFGFLFAPFTSNAAWIVFNSGTGGPTDVDCAAINSPGQTCEQFCSSLSSSGFACDYYPAGPGGGDYISITFLTFTEGFEIETEGGTVHFGEEGEGASLGFAPQPSLIGFRATTPGVDMVVTTQGVEPLARTEGGELLGVWSSPFDVELPLTDGIRASFSSLTPNSVVFEERGAIVPAMSGKGTALLLGVFGITGYATLRRFRRQHRIESPV